MPEPQDRRLERRNNSERKKKQGKKYLLGIGINAYTHCPTLNNAVRDTEAFIQIMQDKYGFPENGTTRLYDGDATREKISDAFEKYADLVKEEDTLVIYYAGHGTLLRDKGYWVPVEAKRDKKAGYIPNSTIINDLDTIKSKHTFLISDACFSGSLFLRSSPTETRDDLPSRYGLSSGRKEFVSDGIPGQHSPFAESVLTVLKREKEPLGVQKFCAEVEALAKVKAPKQTPIGRPLQVEGNDLGQLVLYPKAGESQIWENTLATNSIAGYNAYLKEYPNTEHANEIKQRIKGLEEDAYWETIIKRNTKAAYQGYLKKYPEGRYTADAEKGIKDLRDYDLEEKQRKERTEWEWAIEEEEQQIRPYVRYLKKYPKGIFAKEAKEMIDVLKWKKVCDEVKKYIEASDCTIFNTPAENLLKTYNWETILKRTQADYEAYKATHEIDNDKKSVPQQIFTSKPVNIIVPKGIEDGFILVKGGSFMMGSDEYDSEKPIHKVTLKDFYIDPYLTTVGDFKTFLSESDYKMDWDKPSWKQTNKHPAIYVNWYDAVNYCNWKSEKGNLTPYYRIKGKVVDINETANGYRLPSEAEWEYAARGGQQSKGYQYAGSDTIDEVAWYDENSKNLGKEHENYGTNPVGQKASNELGLYDMSGNVFEWCEDIWHENYKGAPTNGKAWIIQGDESRRVLRGGSCDYKMNNCRSVNRGSNLLGVRSGGIGFRCIRVY